MVTRPLDDPTYVMYSIFGRSFGDLTKAVRLFEASIHSQPTCSQMCSIDISLVFRLLPTVWLKHERGLSDDRPLVLRFGGS